MNTNTRLVFRFLFQLWITWHKTLRFLQGYFMVIHIYFFLPDVIHSHFDGEPNHGY